MFNSPNGQFTNYDPNFNYRQFNPPQQNTILERHDYKHTTPLIHNNLKDNLLNEHIKEYTIILDSKYRDPSLFPSPYKYSILVNQNNRNNNSGIILKELQNIKYIKVDSVVLPRRWKVVDNYFIDETDILNDRYFTLKLSNIVNNNIYSNNQFITHDCLILSRFKKDNENFFNAKPLNTSNEFWYDINNLGSINKFDIEITTEDNDNLADTNNIGIDINSEDINDLSNPLNKLRQNVIVLKIGILENSINKMNWG